MLTATTTSGRFPWQFWLALMAVGVLYILASNAGDSSPDRRLAREERARLCAQATRWVLAADDIVTLERGKFIVEELGCDLA